MPDKSDKLRDAIEIVQFKLRMREELRAKIESAAKESGNSMNAEIVARLEKSFDADKFIQPHMHSAIYGIAFDLTRLENRRGKRWTEDRAIALAMSKVAGDSFRLGTEMADAEKISQAVKNLNDVFASIDRKIGYLEDVGAIAKRPTQSALGRSLFGSKAQPNALAAYAPANIGVGLLEKHMTKVPEKWEAAISLLDMKGHLTTVDLTKGSSEWTLERDGNPLPDEEKVAVAAVLRSLGELKAEYVLRSKEFEEAGAAENAAKAEADELIAGIRNPESGA